MRRITIAGALLCLTLVAGAQEVRVAGSTGTAEIEIPGSGWLQAVTFRRFPEGGRLGTWIDGRVGFEGVGVEAELGPLSVVELVELEADAILLRLAAGSISLESAGTSVVLETRYGRIVTTEAAFGYADGVLDLRTGSATIDYGDRGTREVVAPARIEMGVGRVEPVVR